MRTIQRWLDREHRPALLFLIHSFLFHVGAIGITDVILNFYFVSLGYDRATIATLQSLSRLGGLVTSIPIGLIANRIGEYRIMLLSTVGLVGVHGLYVAFPALPALMVTRFLMGFVYGSQQIAQYPFMLTLISRDRDTRFFAFHNFASMSGMTFGSLIGGMLPSVALLLFGSLTSPENAANAQTPFAYGASLLIAGGIALLSVLPLLLMRSRPAPEASDHKQPTQTASVNPQPSLRTTLTRGMWVYIFLLCLPMLGFGFTGGLTFPFYNLFFRTQFNVTDQAVGTIMSIGWVGMALLALFNPWWERHFGRVGALVVTMLIAAVAFAVLGFSPTLAPAVIAFVVAVSFRNMMQPLYQPLLMGFLPTHLRNFASSVTIVLWSLGWFTATGLSGNWQVTRGFSFVMEAAAVGALLTGISVVLIFRRRAVPQPVYESG